MLEVYDLFWKGIKCGEITYNPTTNQFKAKLLNKVNGEFPIALFTMNGLTEIDDIGVKRWIETRVAPPTRENIRDVLYAKGLSHYSAWGLFKANNGENANDFCTIKLVSDIKDSTLENPR